MKTQKKKSLPPFRAALSKAARAAALSLLAPLLALALSAGGANADGHGPRAKAAASIAPLHSLLAGVMGENPLLLIDPGQSPHYVQLAPSKVRALHDSDIFFYIGGGGETFSDRLLHSFAGKKVAFLETIATLPGRRPNFLTHRGGKNGHRHKDKHGRKKHDNDEHHDERDHDNHDDKHRGHDDEHDDDREEEHRGKHDRHEDEDDRGRGHHKHKHGIRDIHIWLDTDNARRIVKQMADALGEQYPAKRETYRQNAAKTDAKLAALDAEIAAILTDAKGKPFAVAHDAYQYFERRYGLAQPVALRGGLAGGLSARRLRAAREALHSQGIRCVFREPQISGRHLRALVKGGDAVIRVADPIGANIPPGEEHYFAMMRQLAKSFADCLNR